MGAWEHGDSADAYQLRRICILFTCFEISAIDSALYSTYKFWISLISLADIDVEM